MATHGRHKPTGVLSRTSRWTSPLVQLATSLKLDPDPERVSSQRKTASSQHNRRRRWKYRFIFYITLDVAIVGSALLMCYDQAWLRWGASEMHMPYGQILRKLILPQAVASSAQCVFSPARATLMVPLARTMASPGRIAPEYCAFH